MSYILTEAIDRIDFIADKDYKRGELLIKNEMIAVAGFDVKRNELGTFYIRGLFLFDNVKSDDTANIGDAAYWDGTQITTDSNDNKNTKIGYFAKAKADGETTGEIVLNG